MKGAIADCRREVEETRQKDATRGRRQSIADEITNERVQGQKGDDTGLADQKGVPLQRPSAQRGQLFNVQAVGHFLSPLVIS